MGNKQTKGLNTRRFTKHDEDPDLDEDEEKENANEAGSEKYKYAGETHTGIYRKHYKVPFKKLDYELGLLQQAQMRGRCFAATDAMFDLNAFDTDIAKYEQAEGGDFALLRDETVGKSGEAVDTIFQREVHFVIPVDSDRNRPMKAREVASIFRQQLENHEVVSPIATEA